MFSARVKIQFDVFWHHESPLDCTVEVGGVDDIHYFKVIDFRGNEYHHRDSNSAKLITKWRDVMCELGHRKGLLPYDFISTLKNNYPVEYMSPERHPYPPNFHFPF